MTDPPDNAPGERPKCIVTIRLPTDVLHAATNPKTKQPRSDGRPRRVKRGRPRRASVLAQLEADRARLQSHSTSSSQTSAEADDIGYAPGSSQQQQSLPSRNRGKGGSRSQQEPTTRQVPYPQSQAQRRAAQHERDSLRIWQENEPPPLRLNPSLAPPQDYINLPPNAVPLNWGSDGQRHKVQKAWETLNRVETEFSNLCSQSAQQEQGHRQGRVVMNALEQPLRQRYPSTPQYFHPQPVRPQRTLMDSRPSHVQPDGYGVPANNGAATYPRSHALGHPHAHPAQGQPYNSASALSLQPVGPPETSMRATYHVPHADHARLQQQRPSYQSVPTLPQLPTYHVTPTPAPRPHPRQVLFGRPDNLDPNTQYTVNLVNNLHFRNPLLPALDPATQLDYSYLIRNHLQDKEANYIEPWLHLIGGCGETQGTVIQDNVGIYGGGGAADTDAMDLDSAVGVDGSVRGYGDDDDDDDIHELAHLATDAKAALGKGDAGLNRQHNTPSASHREDQPLRPSLLSAAGHTRIEASVAAVKAEFLWDKLQKDVRTTAIEMKRARRGRESVSADVAYASVQGVRWLEESRGPFVEDSDSLGTFVVVTTHASAKDTRQEIEKLGYRRLEDVHRDEEGEGGGVYGDEELRYQTIEALQDENRGTGGALKQECDWWMESSDPWRRASAAETEVKAEVGEFGFSGGGDDMVLGVVDVDDKRDGGQYAHQRAEPEIWYAPGSQLW